MTKRTYKGWTPADDAELLLLREAITPTKEIAKVLKRTPSAVANRISFLKLPMGIKRYTLFGQVPESKIKKVQGPNKQRVEMMKARDHMGRWSMVPESKIETVQGSQPKPAWWTSMMWWRK